MSESQLRVTKLTLFSHGLSQLELSAEVTGDQKLQHTFPQQHMNDILKSLTAVDTGGTISSITYAAPHPDPPFMEPSLTLDKQHALKTLLQTARGARVVAYVGDNAIAATLLGLQWPLLEGDKKREEEVKIVLMQPGWRVVAFDLRMVDGIQFQDPRFQKRLDSLNNTTATKDANNKSVTIITKGAEKRTVVVNYAIESPVPKFTYRFLLNHADEASETVFMQAWAVVDNPTSQDLDDIDMTIVSGMPMSFRYDLYDKRFVSRPTEKIVQKEQHGTPSLATFGFGAPKPPGPDHGHFGTPQRGTASVFGGAGASTGRSLFGADGTTSLGFGAAAPESGFGGQATPDRDAGGRMRSTGGVFGGAEWQDAATSEHAHVTQAESAEIGNLYEYSIPAKVTIKARESALVPLIMRHVEGGRVDIYSSKVRSGNTLSAVRIRNNTDGAFEGGPVCVYERSRLVGEGIMKGCRPGSELFVPYSVNLDCSVEVKEDVVDGGIVKVSVVDGMLNMSCETNRVVKYTFDNRTKKRVVFVLHEIKSGFDKPSAAKGVPPADGGNEGSGGEAEAELREIVNRVATFRMTVAGERKQTLEVTDRQATSRMQSIRSSCTESVVKELQKNEAITEDTARLMGALAKTEQELSSIRALWLTHHTEVQRLKESQQRFRSNVESLGGLQNLKTADDPAIKKFVDGLADSENGIQEMERKISDAEEKGRSAEKTLNETVSEIAQSIAG